MAARFLEEACESKEILQLVVEMRPTMDHLGDAGNPLLLKFTSTPMGFRYLYDAGYIDRELDLWFNVRTPCFSCESIDSIIGEESVLCGAGGSVFVQCVQLRWR